MKQHKSMSNVSETYWFNALWFQSIWFCAVLGREELVLVIAAFLLVHLALVRDFSRELLQLSTVAFAAVTGRSLAFLDNRPALTSLAGAVAFPLTYWAGARLGAVDFGYPLVITLTVVSLVWAIMLPLMFKLTTLIASDGDDKD
ncbi:MAG: DUF2878 domain-containing protein [Halioglobus sp.]